MNRQTLYLLLAVAGFILPNIFVIQESIASGNVLLWLDPMATLDGMFANRITTAFITDLFWVVAVFFIWSYAEAKRLQLPRLMIYWGLTLLFGLAGSFPLFLYAREKKLAKMSVN